MQARLNIYSRLSTQRCSCSTVQHKRSHLPGRCAALHMVLAMAVQPSQCHREVTPEVNQEGNARWHCHINIPACHQSKSWDGFSSFTLPNSVTHQMRDSCCMARCTGKWGGTGSTGAVLPPPLQMIPLALVPSDEQPKRLPQGCPQHQTSTEWSPCSKRPLTLCHVYCLPDAAQDTASPPTISPPLLLRFRPSRC